nr:HAD family hydrolase [Streptomyces anulatus]
MLALFDLDNTLIDRRVALENWARVFVWSRGLPQDAVSIICGQLRARASPEDLGRLGRDLRLGEAPGNLWQEYVHGIAQSSQCFPGVWEGLKALRAEGWTLGVATNGAGDIQRAKLRATGLASLFHGIGISGEIESRKPAGRHFEAAAELCGARLSAGGWMVGDSPETDVEGGLAVGLQTAWVAHGRQWNDGLSAPDLVVQDAAEAIDRMRSSV